MMGCRHRPGSHAIFQREPEGGDGRAPRGKPKYEQHHQRQQALAAPATASESALGSICSTSDQHRERLVNCRALNNWAIRVLGPAPRPDAFRCCSITGYLCRVTQIRKPARPQGSASAPWPRKLCARYSAAVPSHYPPRSSRHSMTGAEIVFDQEFLQADDDRHAGPATG